MRSNRNKKCVKNHLKDFFLLAFLFLCFQVAAQKNAEYDRIKNLVDNLKFVKDIPSICRDSVYFNETLGCGDRIFWRVVQEKKAAIPFLMDKLDDTTQTIVPVPFFGGYYTVADVAYVVMQEIIADIPTFQLLGVSFDEEGCGYCAYWNYLREDFSHRKHFQREVRQWEKRLGGRWVEDPKVLTCDCQFPHPNGGHYIKEYTLSNWNGYGVHLEYSYLKAHSIGIGANFISESFQPFIGKRRINYTVDATITGLFYNHISTLGQRIDLGINVQKTSPDFHVFVEHNDKNDFRIGGKVGISFGNFIYLHYRYSYPLTKYENPYISRHGVVLTFKLNQVPISDLFVNW
jgi:hypothetical protein